MNAPPHISSRILFYFRLRHNRKTARNSNKFLLAISCLNFLACITLRDICGVKKMKSEQAHEESEREGVKLHFILYMLKEHELRVQFSTTETVDRNNHIKSPPQYEHNWKQLLFFKLQVALNNNNPIKHNFKSFGWKYQLHSHFLLMHTQRFKCQCKIEVSLSQIDRIEIIEF